MTGSGPVAPGLQAYRLAAEDAAYASASAHTPKYDSKSLWPSMSGSEYFLKQQWPEGRLLIWKHPGKTGRYHPKREGLDPCDPANWIEASTGASPAELVLDENTDLLLPASDVAYTVGFRGSPVREVMRHLTVEKNAEFRGGGDGRGRKIWGNVWVKAGGRIYSQGSTSFQGKTHTFFRNDNTEPGSGAANCSQYFMFDKAGGSVEFRGHTTVLDEFKLDAGTAIVGPDSVLQPGRSATPRIGKGAMLVLLDGAYFGKWTNEFHRAVDLNCEGTLQGGLPERPLARPALVGFSYRNWPKHDFTKWSSDPKKGIADVRLVSGMFHSGATVRSISSQPGAQLVLTWTGVERTNAVGDPRQTAGIFAEEGFAQLYNSIPRQITLSFAADVTVEGVEFDNVHPGGLILNDLDNSAAWKHVTYGSRNGAPPDELFQQATVDANGAW